MPNTSLQNALNRYAWRIKPLRTMAVQTGAGNACDPAALLDNAPHHISCAQPSSINADLVPWLTRCIQMVPLVTALHYEAWHHVFPSFGRECLASEILVRQLFRALFPLRPMDVDVMDFKHSLILHVFEPRPVVCTREHTVKCQLRRKCLVRFDQRLPILGACPIRLYCQCDRSQAIRRRVYQQPWPF